MKKINTPKTFRITKQFFNHNDRHWIVFSDKDDMKFQGTRKEAFAFVKKNFPAYKYKGLGLNKYEKERIKVWQKSVEKERAGKQALLNILGYSFSNLVDDYKQ